MFGAYVKENRKVVIALAVYTAVFALIFWLYRLPLGAVGYAALVCLFLLLVWFVVDYRRFAVRLRLLRRLEQEITLSTEQLPEPDGALEAQYQALVRALDADRRAQMTRSQRSYQDLVEYYTVWAHQIKTPIAAMRLLLQDADTDEQRALLEQLQSVEQYVEMVLGYLRLESPSSDYVIRNYALDDIVRQAVRKFASQFIRRKLRLEYTPLNVSVITDEKWLLFVIEQVLSNALKYTRSGSVSITLEAPKTLCIRDTGIGIAPEDLPRVFEKGYTGSNGRTDKRATGIGLYLCRRILAKLGHSITIVSTPGVGTTVRIGLEQDALCSVREVLEKVVTDYAILPAKPNMDEFRRAMLVFENHAVIQRIEGRYNQADCRFAILPTILTAVSAERLHEAAAVLRKEENADEEAEENTAD